MLWSRQLDSRRRIGMRQKYQPEGLPDSSRWSKHSGDHRPTRAKEGHPGRVLEKRWHPAGVRYTTNCFSGGLRFAATTGYFLLTLRVKRAAAAVVLLRGLDLMTLVVYEHQVPANADIAQNLASRTRS